MADIQWYPTKSELEKILKEHLEYERENLFHFAKQEGGRYSAKKNFLQGYERFLHRVHVISRDFSKHCSIDSLTHDELKVELEMY